MGKDKPVIRIIKQKANHTSFLNSIAFILIVISLLLLVQNSILIFDIQQQPFPSDWRTNGGKVYHIGHSLVGQDTPRMLGLIASDQGLTSHDSSKWHVGLPVCLSDKWSSPNSAGEGNSLYKNELGTGAYDVVVLTECMSSSLVVSQSAKEASLNFYDYIIEQNSDTWVYMYSTWGHTGEPNEKTWRDNIVSDKSKWKDLVDYVNDNRADTNAKPMQLIPVGFSYAVIYDEIKAGNFEEITGIDDDILKENDASDTTKIHQSSLGKYISSLMHFSVIYNLDPRGIPDDMVQGISWERGQYNVPTDSDLELFQKIIYDIIVEESDYTGFATQDNPVPECGNNIVEPGEECDDGCGGNICGPEDNGDGCSSICEIEDLPNPINETNMTEINKSQDNITDSNSTNTTQETPQPPVCGNNITEAGEFCDDGNIISGDGCSSICKREAIPADNLEDNTEKETPEPLGDSRNLILILFILGIALIVTVIIIVIILILMKSRKNKGGQQPPRPPTQPPQQQRAPSNPGGVQYR
jgi:cysteine-rich repeat protein